MITGITTPTLAGGRRGTWVQDNAHGAFQ